MARSTRRRPHSTARSALAHLLFNAILLWLTVGGAAHADGRQAPGADVAVERQAPFNKWCVAPLCADKPSRHPALSAQPPIVRSASTHGLLEVRLKRALSDALAAAAKSALGPGYNKAIADLAETLAAAAGQDDARLNALGGLGAAALRAALTYHFDSDLPTGACTGSGRIDAIYEGLAASVVLAPLPFPKKTGRVTAACAETAKRASRAVDTVALGAVVSDDTRRGAEATMRTVDAARSACADVTDAPEATRARVKLADAVAHAGGAAETAKAMRALRDAPIPPPTPPDDQASPDASMPGDASTALRASPSAATDPDAGAPSSLADASAMPDAQSPDARAPAQPSSAQQACTAALDALAASPSGPLEALVGRGLGDADVRAVLSALGEARGPASGVLSRLTSRALSVEDLRELVHSLVRSLVGASGLPPEAPVLRDAIELLPRAVVVEAGAPTVNPQVIVAALAEKYDVGDDGRPSLRGLLGFKPTPWLFELNGGIPQVDFSTQQFVGDMSFGYATAKFGVIGRGAIDNYDLSTATNHADYLRALGSLEGWWLTGGAQSKLRGEIRGSGGFQYFDTTTFSLRAGSARHIFDFDSRIIRGSLLVGGRYGAPGDRITLQLLAGGGAQSEDPQTTTFPAAQLQLESINQLSVQFNARVLARFIIVPQIVGARLRGDVLTYSLTRTQSTLNSLPTGGFKTTLTQQQNGQTELHGRLFVDADVASVAGFVPAVFTGIDFLGFTREGESSTFVASVLGAGIVRHGW